MGKPKVTPEGIVAALHKIELTIAQGVSTSSAIKSAGISTATYYRWVQEYGGMRADQIQRLILLKQENLVLRDRLETLSGVIVWDPASEQGGTADRQRPPRREDEPRSGRAPLRERRRPAAKVVRRPAGRFA